MTTQRQLSSRFPYLTIRIQVGGMTYEGEALLDTGFSGRVILPREYLPNEIFAIETNTFILADGSEIPAPTYLGRVELGEFGPIETTVSGLGNEPIIGVQVIRHFSVILDHGKRVLVEP